MMSGYYFVLAYITLIFCCVLIAFLVNLNKLEHMVFTY